MASSIQIVSNATNTQTNTPEVIYTSPINGSGTIVTAFTASNTTEINASYKAYIVGAGDDLSFPQIPYKIVVRLRSDFGAGVDGQTIPPGGSLYVEASAIESIYFTLSGKEL